VVVDVVVRVDSETSFGPSEGVSSWREVSVEVWEVVSWRGSSGVMTITHWLPDQLRLAP
jgi:hypothetical protein